MNDHSIITTLESRLQNLHARIDMARNNLPVLLVAVSKSQPASAIRHAYRLGQIHFAENYLQEALSKQQQTSDLNICWHFIGSVQSNKAKAIASHFDWVHGVDRTSIAERLHHARDDSRPPLNICLQVNISAELSKSGVLSDALLPLARNVCLLPKLRLRGIMCIPAPYQDSHQQRSQFRAAHACYQALQQAGLVLDTLSMGMSDDFEAAILEGATLLRIGTAIFGKRPETVKGS